MNQPAFGSLKLSAELLRSLETLGYTTMTPVQAQTVPLLLNGQDVIAQAKTGSGKTAAFALGLLSRLDAGRFCVQALVLCPTRELADQVAEEIRRLASSTGNIKVLVLCGGRPVGPQATSLEKGVHIVVGTPGRIEDHLQRESLPLENVHSLVLDEADRMLQMGFQESIDNIVGHIPAKRQTVLLSATYPSEIQAIAKQYLHQPEMVVVDADHDQSSIKQHFYEVAEGDERLEALCRLLFANAPESALVFCNTKIRVREVSEALAGQGVSVIALHGELSQPERDLCLMKFTNRSVQVLVATDVAARGLDIDDLDVVVNFNVAYDPEVHVHRVGRTGRAGRSGQAWTFYSMRERKQYALLSDSVGKSIKPETLPPRSAVGKTAYRPLMVTLQIEAGKKQKLRPADILGALTGEGGVNGADVGKIKIGDRRTYVAVARTAVKVALEKLNTGKIKGRSYRVRSV